jgi:DNA repair protein RadC
VALYLRDEVQGRGTINRAPVYPREVVRRCLELHAASIIMVHNHPSGDPSPSQEDIVVTGEVARAAAIMGISLHDHIIVGRFGNRSFRQENLL